MHLKLDYCLTRVWIGRPFLFSNIRGVNSAPSQGSNPPFKMTSGTSKNRNILVTDCVEAALEIVDLCRLLRDEAGLARASFTEFSSCRAALLVILAQSLTKRTERLREALDKGMGLIKIMSMGVGSARSAVSVIEALERAIRRLEEWSSTQGGTNNPGIVESAYDRFKNWEMLWKSGPLSPSSVFASAASNNGSGNGNNNGTTPLPVTPMIPNISPPPHTDTISNANHSPDNFPDHHHHHHNHTVSSDFSPTGIPTLPHFGFDHFVSNFPQELDEFTAIPCFETDPGAQQQPGQGQNQGQQRMGQGPGHGHGQSPPGLELDNRWMQFINSD